MIKFNWFLAAAICVLLALAGCSSAAAPAVTPTAQILANIAKLHDTSAPTQLET
ncbi:MAG: hypothetical protein ACYDBJ_16360 [Aggregatilineales bacterium]